MNNILNELEYSNPEPKEQSMSLNELATLANATLTSVIRVELQLRTIVAELAALAPPRSNGHPPQDRQGDAEDDLMTIAEVARKLGVCENTLQKLRRSADFPEAIKISERKLRFRREEVERWLSAGGNPDGRRRSTYDQTYDGPAQRSMKTG
jgi:predicted DNA-binding transcriptional regulator AlpA